MKSTDPETSHRFIDKLRARTYRTMERRVRIEEVRNHLEDLMETASELRQTALVWKSDHGGTPIVSSASKRCDALEQLTEKLNQLRISDVHFDIHMKTLVGELRQHIAVEAHKVFLENPRMPSAYHPDAPVSNVRVRRLLSIIRLWWQDFHGGGTPLPSWGHTVQSSSAPEDSKPRD